MKVSLGYGWNDALKNVNDWFMLLGFLLLLMVALALFTGCSKEEKAIGDNYTSGSVLQLAREHKIVNNFDLLERDIHASGQKIMLSEIADNKTLHWLKQTKNISDSQVCFTDSDCSSGFKCIGHCRVMDKRDTKYLESWVCRLDEWANHTDVVPVINMGLCMGEDKWPD